MCSPVRYQNIGNNYNSEDIHFVYLYLAVLDGIGKGLDPRFDITEIAKP